jgi:hypothetical protein
MERGMKVTKEMQQGFSWKGKSPGSLRDRAIEIETIVCRDYLNKDVDAAGLALEELHRNSNRSNDTIAHVVAQLIEQA